MTLPLFGAPQEERTSDDYYTPKWLFDLFDVTFDIDVAAPPGGVDWIPADHYYTKADDGLAQDWTGRTVWCNPPFSKPSVWARKFAVEAEGLFLGPQSKSPWVPTLWTASDCVWIPRTGGIPFVGGEIFIPVFIAAKGTEYEHALHRAQNTAGGVVMKPTKVTPTTRGVKTAGTKTKEVTQCH